jgi:hypothetical protein
MVFSSAILLFLFVQFMSAISGRMCPDGQSVDHKNRCGENFYVLDCQILIFSFVPSYLRLPRL